MKPVCEVVSRYILPAARALIARDLIEVHGLTQSEAARRLGMTQPAMSQYKRQLRGNRVELLKQNPEVNRLLGEITQGVANRQFEPKDMVLKFCEICKFLRSSGSLYELCAVGAGTSPQQQRKEEDCRVCLE